MRTTVVSCRRSHRSNLLRTLLWTCAATAIAGLSGCAVTPDGHTLAPKEKVAVTRSAVTLNCPAPLGSPTLTLDPLSTYSTAGNVSGHAYCVDPVQFRVATFIRVDGVWWAKPNASPHLVAPDSTGAWTAILPTVGSDLKADTVAAFLVPSGYVPPQSNYVGFPSLPKELALRSVASARQTRKSFDFSGYAWIARDSGGLAAPPKDNVFSSANVGPDSNGLLRLKLAQSSTGSWSSAETFTSEELGYGTYTFELASAIDALDLNAVASVFTYENDDRENDIEFSRWLSSGHTNQQFVVQPTQTPTRQDYAGHVFPFYTTPGLNLAFSKHTIDWYKGSYSERVAFESFDAGGASYKAWTFPGPDADPAGPLVPPAGESHARVIYWLDHADGQAPSPSSSQPPADLLVKSFQFKAAPLLRNLGSDAIPFEPNDDGTFPCSSSKVGIPDACDPLPQDLGFTVNFYGRSYTQVYINNNGNLTFDGPLGTYTPFNLLSTESVIIAPFFADVDTRAGTDQGGLVKLNHLTVEGHPAFGVTWPGVRCFNVDDPAATTLANSFQVVLISLGNGDFDIEFNYETINWETGQASGSNATCAGGTSARVGFSNGKDVSFELAGSGKNGAFFDKNPFLGLVHGHGGDSTQNGRYVYRVQSGSAAQLQGSISGKVTEASTAAAVANARVQACTLSGLCKTGSTDATGAYALSSLSLDDYVVTAFSPAGSQLLPGTAPVTLTPTQPSQVVNLALAAPVAAPSGTSITSRSTSSGNIPVLDWNATSLLQTTQTCTTGAPSYDIVLAGRVLGSGGMSFSGGAWTAQIPALRPNTGYARVEIICPNVPANTPPLVAFDVYIDPSGVVRTTQGVPISGATVTLLYSDRPDGLFVAVPNGDDRMSTANRTNPDTSDAAGRFGWDVFAGFYKIHAEKSGCTGFAESAVLEVPPAISDLELVLNCPDLHPSIGGPYTVTEGGAVTLTASGTDPAGQPLSYAWDLDGDGVFETSGQTVVLTGGLLDGPRTLAVAVRVTNAGGFGMTAVGVVTVLNASPVLGEIVAPSGPVQIQSSVTLTDSFSDPGVLDSHSATWDWGDGSTSTGTVTESAGSGSVAGNHVYGVPGVYTTSLRLVDKDGGSAVKTYQYVVAYDPAGGFVTGGGFIVSPAGAYAAAPTATGKATFGFEAKYKKGASVPTGQTRFVFQGAGFDFQSTSYDWLVVTGSAKAQWKGVGTVGGRTGYAFMVKAVDGDANSPRTSDLLRVKVWNASTGAVVYDNQMGQTDDATPSTAIGGGNIQIHP
jgi:hypothetical protein